MCVSWCVEKGAVCLFQGMTVLGPGQSLVQYFEGELCYTVQCLHYKDPLTGFHAMEITSVNCSQKCGPVRAHHINTNITFVISLYACIAWSCLNLLCVFSTRCTRRPQTLRCAVAPVKTSPVPSPTKTDRRSFSQWERPSPRPRVFDVQTCQSTHECKHVCAGREFLGGELHTLRLRGDSSGSGDSCVGGYLSSFQWFRMHSGQSR